VRKLGTDGPGKERFVARNRIRVTSSLLATVAIAFAAGHAALPRIVTRDRIVHQVETEERLERPAGMSRGELVLHTLLETAPGCDPTVMKASAPSSEEDLFVRQAKDIVSSKEEDGYVNASYRVERKGDRVYGVIYFEDCGLGKG